MIDIADTSARQLTEALVSFDQGISVDDIANIIKQAGLKLSKIAIGEFRERKRSELKFRAR
jgi:hypothetical protein